MNLGIRDWNAFLVPPQGYHPTDLLALTYSLHPTVLEETLVQSELPWSYAHSPENLAEHVLVFCQKNRWLDSGALWSEHLYTRLLLSRNRIVGIEGKTSSFHPKMLAILYAGNGSAGGQLLRLVISSRNLTQTANLEAALCLETTRFEGGNPKPWRMLLDGQNVQQNAVFQKLEQADFTSCAEQLFGSGASCEFLVSGEKEGSLAELLRNCGRNARRFAAVSPFLGKWEYLEQFLPVRAGKTPFADVRILTNRGISRELYNKTHGTGLLTNPGRGAGAEDPGAERFLHAKMYAFTDARGRHHLLIGSANFSENGLERNTELMAHLTSGETDFCQAIWDSAAENPVFEPQEDSDTRPPACDLPAGDPVGNTTLQICDAIREQEASAELAELFYRVFRQPVRGRAPVDYAVDMLGSCVPPDTAQLEIWRQNLEAFGAGKALEEPVRTYWQRLKTILDKGLNFR